MDNAATTNVPIADLLARRWSPRAFADRALSREQLEPLLEAARWAPSCFNAQPWRFILCLRSEERRFEDALAGLNPFNRSWAAQAQAIGFSIARTRFEHNDKANRYAWHDVGAASALFAVQAAHEGLAVHQVAGIEREVVHERFGLRDPFEVVAGLVIGWPGDPDSLADEKLRERERAPRVRKPASELIFPGRAED